MFLDRHKTNVITFGMRGMVWNAICFVTSDLYLKYNVYFIEIGENSVLYLKCNVCFIEIGEKPVIYLKYNVYFIEIGENCVLYLKCNVYFIEKKKENGYNLKIGH